MNDKELEQLILKPSERMDTELKRWMDPAAKETIAKIARACIALRNQNGGYLIFGFDDTTGEPDAAVPGDINTVRAMFHADVIQGIVSKYASQQIEIQVRFPRRGDDLRRLWDDTQSGMPPKLNLDYSLQIMQVTEAVSITSHFARALGCDETKTTLGFACRWTGLKGRRLYAWSSNPLRGYASMPATQDAITTKIAMPLETPESAFAPVVKALVMPMLDLFVAEAGRIDLEKSVKETLSRKLGSH